MPAVSSRPTAGRSSPEASREERPDLLAARALERAHRLRADDAVRACRPRRESRPFGRALKPASADRRAPLPRADRARHARAARHRARRSTRPCTCRRSRSSFPGCPRIARSRRRSASSPRSCGADRASRSPCAAGSARGTGAALHWATYVVFAHGDRPRTRGGHRLGPAVGARPLPRRRRRRRRSRPHGARSPAPTADPIPVRERST